MMPVILKIKVINACEPQTSFFKLHFTATHSLEVTYIGRLCDGNTTPWPLTQLFHAQPRPVGSVSYLYHGNRQAPQIRAF